MFGIDDAILAAGLKVGGDLIGGAIGAAGQQGTNAQMMAFNAQQAQINRDWETQMSNTAYQRAMADMRAAGLNPILAANLGGASTPGMSTPGVTLGNPGSLMGAGVSSAAGAGATYAATKGVLTQAEKDASATKLNDASTDTQKATTDLTRAGVDRTKQETITSAANADAARASAAASNTQANNNAIQNLILKANVNSAEADARMKQLEADAAAKYGPGAWGHIATNIERMFGTARSMTSKQAFGLGGDEPSKPLTIDITKPAR